MSDGAFHGGPHLTEGDIKLGLTEAEVAAREPFEWHRLDSVNADIAQVGHGRKIGEKVGQAGGSEGVRVVSGAMDRYRSDCDECTVESRGYLEIHAGKPYLGREQIRNVMPVPRWTDSARRAVGLRKVSLVPVHLDAGPWTAPGQAEATGWPTAPTSPTSRSTSAQSQRTAQVEPGPERSRQHIHAAQWPSAAPNAGTPQAKAGFDTVKVTDSIPVSPLPKRPG